MVNISGFPNYTISKDGIVRNRRGVVIYVSKSKKGYVRCTLSHKGKKQKPYIHRLIALHFIPNPENKPCINHKNGNKADNRIENLEWCTIIENNKHAVENKLNSAFRRPVVKLDWDGNVLKEYPSAAAAKKENKNIWERLAGRAKNQDYILRYKN